MRWRKRPKEIDVSRIQLPEPAAQLDLSAIPATGPAVHISVDRVQPPRPLDRERDWAALGPRAWQILKRRRMAEIFPPPDTKSEFQRYLEVLACSPREYREEVFIGLQYPGWQPQFVPRKVFQNHAYILGGSGSGKTSHAVAQLLIQLAQGYTDRKGRRHPPPPILIIELKQNGDRYLRAFASDVARARRQELLFFSNEPAYESLIFEPFAALWRTNYPIKRLETLLKAFSLIYPEGYGSDFFTNEQRQQLQEILFRDRPQTYDELLECIRVATREGRSANADARGLYSAMSTLCHAAHVNTGPSLDPTERIDFDRFFDERQMLYVHLDARSMHLLSRDIAKLMLFGLLETAAERERKDQKVQAFVFLDEFHRLAARNIVEMLEDARGAGVGFVLSHQSSSSLKTRDADLYGILFENCSFKQCLTLKDPRVIDLFRAISPRTVERRTGGSQSTTKGKEKTSGWSHGGSDTSGHAVTKGPGWFDTSETSSSGSGHTHTNTGGTSESESSTEAKSWHEEVVSALTPEVIQQVNDVNLLSLVHVKGVGDDSLTPTHGAPIPVTGLYPVLEATAEKMQATVWPLDENLDPEKFYAKARPKISTDAVTALSGRKRGRRPGAGGPAAAPGTFGPTGDSSVREQLQNRLLQLAQRMADDMLRPMVSPEGFARRNGIPVADVLGVLAELGIAVDGPYGRLKSREVAALKRRLIELGKLPRRKDNGPQAGPVV